MSPRRHRQLAVVAVSVIALLGVGLRAAQAAAYLPWEHHWDEITNVGVGEGMADELDPDPGFYDYPALIFLAQALVLVPAAQLGGYDPGETEIITVQTRANGHVNEPGLLLAMRWVAGVIPGIVTLVAAAAIAWTVTSRWWTSALAALLVALSAVDLRYGMFVTPDALTGMGATLAVLGAVRLAQDPSRRHYLLTGAAVGLAAAAKYNAGAVAVALVIAHLIAHRRPLAARRPLLEAAGVAAAVFAVVNVGGLLHPYRFVAEIGSEGVHYGSEQLGSQGNSPLFNAYWLWVSFGLALLLAACGLATRSVRVRQATYVVGGFAASYYVFVSVFPVRFARNLLPVTGSIAAAAAIGLFALVERIGPLLERRVARVATALAAAGLLVWVPTLGASSATASIASDPWADARSYIADSIPEGSTLAVEARAPFVDPDRYQVVRTVNLGDHDLDWYRRRGVDAFVAVDVTFQPYFDHPDEDPEMTGNYREILADECVAFEAEGGAYETQDSDHRIVVLRVPPC